MPHDCFPGCRAPGAARVPPGPRSLRGPFGHRDTATGLLDGEVSVRIRCAAGFIAAAWLTAAAGTRLEAQNYFGRNKGPYKQANFKILRPEPFDIYFYPSEREGIAISARLAERWHARLERLLSHTLRGRQPLVLYAAPPHLAQTKALQSEIG